MTETLLDKVAQRRKAARHRFDAGMPDEDPQEELTGLALSGGGVRSAAFSAGVLAEMYHVRQLQDIDLISSVSGGGYVPLSVMANAGSCSADSAFAGNRLYRAIFDNLHAFNSNKNHVLFRSIRGLVSGLTLLFAIMALFWVFVRFVNIYSPGEDVVLILLIVNCTAGLSYALFKSLRIFSRIAQMTSDPKSIVIPVLAINTIVVAHYIYLLPPVQVAFWCALCVVWLTLLSAQKNPKKQWILYSIRHGINAFVGNGKAAAAGMCVLFLATIVANAIIPLLLDVVVAFAEAARSGFESMTVQDAASRNAELARVVVVGMTALAFLVTVRWLATRSNARSMHEPYQRYLDELLKGGAGKFSDPAPDSAWFPLCVANISVLWKGAHRHANISPLGIELPDDQLYPWDKVETTSIAEYKGAMALSGAALDVGITTSRLYRYLMTTFGINTGLWLTKDQDRLLSAQGPCRIFDLALTFDDRVSAGKRNYIKAADGGHFDNTGVFYLLKIRAATIYCFDASYDPDDTAESLRVLMARARQELDVDIALDSDRGAVLVFRLHYSDQSSGTLFYVKHTRVPMPGKGWGRDVSSSFPNDSTFNQFLSEDLFDAYYQLGLNAARELCRVIDRPARSGTAWRGPHRIAA
ncbi:hypothetical protein [Massilia sp. DD77]|uniref:hypothetical protein n=1 Tax=Massilia sp. DD77 TaxID=3109349 RepID=UPI002FFF7326